jgi:hypothetical protein
MIKRISKTAAQPKLLRQALKIMGEDILCWFSKFYLFKYRTRRVELNTILDR